MNTTSLDLTPAEREAIDRFEDCGRRASFLLADDTGSGAWRGAGKLKQDCMDLYRENVGLRVIFLAIAQEYFIWVDDFAERAVDVALEEMLASTPTDDLEAIKEALKEEPEQTHQDRRAIRVIDAVLFRRRDVDETLH